MIIVTGGAGFIGSNIIKTLNEKGHTDIIVVDDLTDGIKFNNLARLEIADYLDKADFLQLIESGKEFGKLTAVFHEGACATTTEWDGRYLMHNNYAYSKALLHYCLNRQVPFLYASSAAVYGNSKVFALERAHELPLNAYGYSKLQFDQYVRRLLPTVTSQVVGLRYFNVYGPHESHKASMASVAFHQYQQICRDGIVKLFAGCDGYGDGEQRRDFIYVEDVAKVNLWFWENPRHRGIFNVGTGRAENFNAVANAVIAWKGRGRIEYIPFPEQLQGRYQSFTEADITGLRAAGYTASFKTVAEGVQEYLTWLATSQAAARTK